MLKSLEDIKKFIIWCKDNKIKSFKSENMQFELSDIAFIPELNDVEAAELAQEVKEKYNLADEISEENEDDLLFYSSDKQ